VAQDIALPNATHSASQMLVVNEDPVPRLFDCNRPMNRKFFGSFDHAAQGAARCLKICFMAPLAVHAGY